MVFLQFRQLKNPVTNLTKLVTRFGLSILSMVADVHILEKDMGRERVAGWHLGPVKAMVVWVMSVHPPTLLHHPL